MSLGNFPDFFLNFSGRKMNGEMNHSYRFKSFRLDVADRRLFRNSVPVSLEPKVFDVLVALVERGGHLVEKEALLRTVWADSFVEETNVARAIYTLRKTLGEDGNGNKFIETVPKKGYRFIPEITLVPAPEKPKTKNRNENAPIAAQEFSSSDLDEFSDKADLQNPADGETAAPPFTKPNQKRRIILFAGGLLVAVFLILLGFFYFRPGAANLNTVKSIAVLPVKPINAGIRDELYEIGIAESIIHRLSATKSFYVRPLSATRQYTDLAHDPIAAGREQKTDYVLSSNYQLAEGKIRVTAQLFNVATGQIEETYKSEKDASSVFAAQDAISSEIGNILFARFDAVANKTVQKLGTTNEEAYRFYLQGKNLTAKRSPSDAQKAIEYFEQAVRIDPNFASAYASMAYAYRASGTLGGGFPREQFEKAKEAVNKALELDSNLAEAYAVRGDLRPRYERDWAGAESDLLRAVELEPNNDLAHAIYADFLVQRYSRFDEALAEIETALAINPGSLAHLRDRGRIFYFARRYDEAIVELKRVLEIDKNFNTAYGWLWRAYAMKGDDAGAYEYFIKNRANADYIEPLQKAYETVGWQGLLRKRIELQKLDEQKPHNYYEMATCSAMTGEKEQALEYMNKAIEKGQSQIVMFNIEPAFDSLRDDPRYRDLMKRIGF